MPVNRKLSITVTFSCTKNDENDFGGSATYTKTGSTPDMGDIVDADGKIHLENALAYNSQDYNENVDIEFTLATPCSVSDNTTIPVAWATQYGAGMTIQVPAGGNQNEMSVVVDPNNPNLITVLDKDDDSNVYNYKPALELIRPNLPNYYISLDPKIVNRPHT
jgi:hypothetical protein